MTFQIGFFMHFRLALDLKAPFNSGLSLGWPKLFKNITLLKNTHKHI